MKWCPAYCGAPFHLLREVPGSVDSWHDDRMNDPFENLSLAELQQRNSVKWSTFEQDVLPLWVAEMDVSLAPGVAQALNQAIALGDTGYATPGGLPAAFAEFARQRFGWHLKASTPVLVADVMAGVRTALEIVSEPGDRVVISTPIYPPFFANVNRMKRQVVASPLKRTANGYELDLDRLDRDFAGSRVYLLCNPHNPIGRVYGRDELMAIAQLAQRHNVTVISDEIHAPLTMLNQHVPFATLDAAAASCSYTMVAASKAWNLAGLKAALMIPGADTDAAKLSAALVDDDLWAAASLFGAIAGEAAFSTGQAWLDDMLIALDDRRNQLVNLLAEQLPKVKYIRPQSTYLAWLDFSEYEIPGDVAQYLLQHGRVALNSGVPFGGSKDFVRLNFATRKDVLGEAVRRIAGAVAR